MAEYVVNSIVAVLPLKAGSERYFYRNAVVSDETITEDGITHALSAGLIVAAPAPLEEAEVASFPEGDPADTWNVKQLEAYAAANSIDLTSASKKDEKLALIVAHSK